MFRPTHRTIRMGRHSAERTLISFRVPHPRHVSAIEISPMAIVLTERGYITQGGVIDPKPANSKKIRTIPRTESTRATIERMKWRELRDPLYGAHFRWRASTPLTPPRKRGISQRGAPTKSDRVRRI